MSNKNSIETLTSELVGISDALYLLSHQFESKNERTELSNEIIGGTLHSLAAHLERITDDLDSIEAAS